MIKKLNLYRILFTFISLILLIFAGYISLANIIPFKYLTIIYLILFLWVVILYFLLVFKTKKGKNKPRKIIGVVISVFLLCIVSLITYYINNTLSFFRNFGDNVYKEENYLVLVKTDSTYSKIEDLNNIGYVYQELGNISKAIDKVKEKKELEFINYEAYNVLMKDVIDSKIDSLIIEESYYTMISETLDYSSNLKILDKISVITDLDTVTKEADVTKDTFTIYISGIDTYGKITGVSRSDVNIIATVNPTTKQVLLVSIPRDYYVQLRGTTGLKDKLTHAGVYGIDMSIGTLEDLLDVSINYYFRVNFSTLESVIDAIDGVDVYSQYEFTSSGLSGGDAFHFSKGYNHMNGKQALAFSRERYHLPSGDRGRGMNQQAVIDGIIRKVVSPTILTKYTAILNSLKDTFQTNMTENDIQKLIKMQLNDMATWNVTSYSLDGYDGEYEYTYSAPYQKLYVMHPNQDTVIEAGELIDKVYAGEILKKSYEDVSNIKDPTTVIVPAPQPIVPQEPEKTENDIIDDNPSQETPIEEPIIPGLPSEDEKDDNKQDDTTDSSSNEGSSNEGSSNQEETGNEDNSDSDGSSENDTQGGSIDESNSQNDSTDVPITDDNSISENNEVSE